MAKNATKTEDLPDSVDDQLESVIEYSEDISTAERPEPLPVGEYAATVLQAVKKHGKESGRPYAEVRYQIDSSDMPADYVQKYQIDKKTITGRHFFLEDTPQARYGARQYCQAVGAAMSNRLNLADFTGLTCKIEINHEDDLEGLPRENIRRVNKA